MDIRYIQCIYVQNRAKIVCFLLEIPTFNDVCPRASGTTHVIITLGILPQMYAGTTKGSYRSEQGTLWDLLQAVTILSLH